MRKCLIIIAIMVSASSYAAQADKVLHRDLMPFRHAELYLSGNPPINLNCTVGQFFGQAVGHLPLDQRLVQILLGQQYTTPQDGQRQLLFRIDDKNQNLEFQATGLTLAQLRVQFNNAYNEGLDHA